MDNYKIEKFKWVCMEDSIGCKRGNFQTESNVIMLHKHPNKSVYAFSGHKLYGPTGIGVLYGKRELLERMPPFMGGGDMVDTVTFAKTTYAPVPLKFEAGTANFVGAIGLGEAVKFMQRFADAAS